MEHKWRYFEEWCNQTGSYWLPLYFFDHTMEVKTIWRNAYKFGTWGWEDNDRFFIFVWTVLFVSPGNLLKWQHKYTSRNWYFSAFYGIRLCQVEHYVQIILHLHFEQNLNKQIRVVQFGRMWSELPLPNINLIQFRFICMFWENQWHISLCVSSIKS